MCCSTLLRHRYNYITEKQFTDDIVTKSSNIIDNPVNFVSIFSRNGCRHLPITKQVQKWGAAATHPPPPPTACCAVSTDHGGSATAAQTPLNSTGQKNLAPGEHPPPARSSIQPEMPCRADGPGSHLPCRLTEAPGGIFGRYSCGKATTTWCESHRVWLCCGGGCGWACVNGHIAGHFQAAKCPWGTFTLTSQRWRVDY